MLRIQGNAVLAAVLMATVVHTSPLPAQTPRARIMEVTPIPAMPQPSARPADAGPEFGAAVGKVTVPVDVQNSVLPVPGDPTVAHATAAAPPPGDAAETGRTDSLSVPSTASHDANCLPLSLSMPAPFAPDPDYSPWPYDSDSQLEIYEGKRCDPTQRPWIELGRGLYRFGQLPPAIPVPFGQTNLTIPHFLLYGDFRTAVAYNDNGPDEREQGVIANRLNLDLDWKLTATERIHMFWGPLDRGGRFTRMVIDDEDIDIIPEFDDNFDTFFFEGDAGAMWGGWTEQWAPFDLPFTAGKYPLLLQNGIWIVDALEGFALSVITQNSPALGISNYDVTFFAGFDDIDSPAFGNDDNAANVYGLTTFADAWGGYLELGYAYLDDTTGQERSYHNATVSFTRRYGQRVSNSVRVIVNSGQSPRQGPQTADGVLLLLENQLVSSNPTCFVPYLNLFAGFDVPQSVARAVGTGGVLVNTGINFETDGLTGYPTLDATANNSYGGALGVNLLGPDFAWQYIVELATVQTFGEARFRQAVADQYGIGTRLQIPVNNAWLVRFDMMYGLLEDADDIGGARMELRWKF